MRLHKTQLRGWRHALATSAFALFAVGRAMAADAAQPEAAAVQPAAGSYAPTMADYLSIYDALQRYRVGVDKHDRKMQDSAFWEAPKPAGPPPGFKPPPGFSGGPPEPGTPGYVDVWHMPLDSYIHFESATRATHYGYFISVYPQPEKKVEGDRTAGPPNASAMRTSIVGWPGHYDDVLEKRNGEWRILQRKIKINEK